MKDTSDAAQCAVVGQVEDVERLFNADFISCVPESWDVVKRWLLEMNRREREVYGPVYPDRQAAKNDKCIPRLLKKNQ